MRLSLWEYILLSWPLWPMKQCSSTLIPQNCSSDGRLSIFLLRELIALLPVGNLSVWNSSKDPFRHRYLMLIKNRRSEVWDKCQISTSWPVHLLTRNTFSFQIMASAISKSVGSTGDLSKPAEMRILWKEVLIFFFFLAFIASCMVFQNIWHLSIDMIAIGPWTEAHDFHLNHETVLIRFDFIKLVPTS